MKMIPELVMMMAQPYDYTKNHFKRLNLWYGNYVMKV